MAFIIAGLGNPGIEYEKTRHNAGRMAVQLFAKQNNFDAFVFNKKSNALVAHGTMEGGKVTLILPETMMNNSGKALGAVVKTPKAAKSLVVVHDDLDLPLGTIKMVSGRGSGGHKGVESVMRAIKTKDFIRLRIGVAPVGRHQEAKKLHDEEKVIKHVIGKFKPTEETELKKALKKTTEVLSALLRDGVAQATMIANTR